MPSTFAGGLLVASGLTGFDTLGMLAADDAVNLPLISHPALLGSLVISPEHGFGHAMLFGQLQRLAGADASIYPNYGGRFAFSRASAPASPKAGMPMGRYPPIFPTPDGGIVFAPAASCIDLPQPTVETGQISIGRVAGLHH